MKLNNLANSLKKAARITKFKLKKHAPTIMIAAAAVGTVAGTVMACKATLKLEDTLDDIKNNVEDVKADETLTEKERKNELTKTYIRGGMAMAKLYGPAVLLIGSSIGLNVGSHVIMKKRYGMAVAAATAIKANFDDYKNYIREKYGEEADFNAEHHITETKTTEGKGKNKKESITLEIDPAELEHRIPFYFDQTCLEHSLDGDYDIMMIKQRQAEANIMLRRDGFVTYNKIRDMFGKAKTKWGDLVGWVYDPELNGTGDVGYIDFRINDYIENPKIKNYLNQDNSEKGFDRRFYINPNIQGFLFDSMETVQKYKGLE